MGRALAIAQLPLILLILLASAITSTSCARRGASVVSTCVLPDDQTGTLRGRWKVPPIPIAFHQGDFSTEEMTEIIKAANTWNSFYSTTLGLSPIDYGTADNPRLSTTAKPNSSTLCNQSLIADAAGKFSGAVVLYKLGVWPYPSLPNAMALTSFCPTTAGSPLPFFNMSIIEFNYQNFFVSGKQQPDLQTIILHEFGHLLGLNHSCESNAATGVPGCSGATTPPEYKIAVMNPTFSFNSSGYGESKRVLTANDQGRANCLYSY